MKHICLLSLSLLPVALFAMDSHTVVLGKNSPLSSNTYAHSFAGEAKLFPNTFKIWIPAVKQHVLRARYACKNYGKNISPAIRWQGIPKGSERLHITLEDSSCTLGCDSRGKFDHWVLDFPVSALKNSSIITPTGIVADAANTKAIKAYTRANGLNLKAYIGPCPPDKQTHAFVIKATAYRLNKYKKPIVIAYSQSVPFLFAEPKQ